MNVSSIAIRGVDTELQRLKAENERLREVLFGFIDDEPCWYDHHGYCQAHFSGEIPCYMAEARAFRAELAAAATEQEG